MGDAEDDWEGSRYRLLPGPAGLASSSGLDEEAFLALSRAVLEPQRAAAKTSGGGGGGEGRKGGAEPSLLLLAGPAGSGKSYLIGCLPAECPDSLVLSVPALGLLPRRREDPAAAGAAATVRRLFEFALGCRQPCILAIENLDDLLLDEAAASESGQTTAAQKVAQEIAGCLQACRRGAGSAAALAVIVTTRRPWLLSTSPPPLSATIFHHRLSLACPDRRRRRQVLANVAKRPDAFAPFRESLSADDLLCGDDDADNDDDNEDGGGGGGRVLRAVLAGSEGMSPGDLMLVLHHAANYPLKQLVYRRVRLAESVEQRRLDPDDIRRVLAECRAAVSQQEWQRYADWAAPAAS